MASNNIDQNICALCLETTVSVGGGVPLASPGCCGKWFHQKCLDECIKKSNGLCPCCRAALPNSNSQQTVVQGPQSNQLSQQTPVPSLIERAANVFRFNSRPQPQTFQQQQQQQRWQQRPSRSAAENSTNSDMVEDDLPPIQATPTDVSATLHDGESDSCSTKFVLSSATEFPTIGSRRYADFHAIATIGIREDSNILETRKGMDIVCVLDKSGSMSGAKFTALKHAMRFVQSQLTANDRLSIVAFDHRAQGVHGLFAMNASQKSVSEEKVNNLSAGGGTSILDGMKLGYNVLQHRKVKNTISCMFLLTDGVDDACLSEKKRLASNMKADGTGLYVFAFGADHNSAHLNAIASAAESSYIYVENSDEVIDAFGGALGSQQGLAAKNITLKITAPEGSNIKFDEVNAGDYSTHIMAGSASAEVQFSNLFSGEKRDVLIRLLIPAADPDAVLPDPQFGLFSLSASYNPIGESTMLLETSADENSFCSVARVAEDVSAAVDRHIEVDAQMYRLKVSELLKQAMDMGDRSLVDEARKMLTVCVTEIIGTSVSYKAEHSITKQLIDDLNTAINGMRNEMEYRSRGGRSLMTEAYSSNINQRSNMTKAGKTKSPYQTVQSDCMQSRSKSYKSAFY